MLGDSDFVERVLKAADGSFERKDQLKSQGYDKESRQEVRIED